MIAGRTSERRTPWLEIGWLRQVFTTPLHPAMLLAAQLIIDLALVFGASRHVQLLSFVAPLLLAIFDIFALGLALAALVPIHTVASFEGSRSV